MFYRYGTNIDLITAEAFEFHQKYTNWEEKWREAEAKYVAMTEHFTSFSDFWEGRTSSRYFEPRKTKMQAQLFAEVLARYFGWNKDFYTKNLEEYNI